MVLTLSFCISVRLTFRTLDSTTHWVMRLSLVQTREQEPHLSLTRQVESSQSRLNMVEKDSLRFQEFMSDHRQDTMPNSLLNSV